MKKKLLASLLAFCMFVGMAVPVFAIEVAPTASAKILYVNKDTCETETVFNSLTSAIAAASKGDTIELQTDVPYISGQAAVKVDKEVTIDGKDKMIELGMNISANATIKNLKLQITHSGTGAEDGNTTAAIISSDVKLNVENCTIMMNMDEPHKPTVIGILTNKTELTATGNTFSITADDPDPYATPKTSKAFAYGIYVMPNPKSTIIEGNTFKKSSEGMGSIDIGVQSEDTGLVEIKANTFSDSAVNVYYITENNENLGSDTSFGTSASTFIGSNNDVAKWVQSVPTKKVVIANSDKTKLERYTVNKSEYWGGNASPRMNEVLGTDVWASITIQVVGPTKQDLLDTINANKAKMVDVLVIDDKTASQVAKGIKFVTTADKEAITQLTKVAQDMYDSTQVVTPDKINEAISNLNHAADTLIKIGTYVAPPTGGGSYNPPASSPSPVAPPVVTESAGKTEIVASPTISETMTTNNVTVAKAEVKIDSAITDKATVANPVQIKAELPTADVKSAIENSFTKQVEIKLTVPNAVATNKNVSITEIKADKSIFEQAKISDKEIILKVETADGKLVASWSFDGAKITNNAVDVNLAVNLVKAATLPAINTAGADVATKPLVVSFNHSGNLPTIAKVTLDVSADYNDGEELFLYYFNSTTKKLELISKCNKVLDGKVAIAISHCSDYVLTKSAVKTTTAPKTTNISKATNVPKTGDTSPVNACLVLAVLAGALIITRKELCK